MDRLGKPITTIPNTLDLYCIIELGCNVSRQLSEGTNLSVREHVRWMLSLGYGPAIQVHAVKTFLCIRLSSLRTPESAPQHEELHDHDVQL